MNDTLDGPYETDELGQCGDALDAALQREAELLTMLQEMVADSDDVDDGKLRTISAATLTRARQVIAKAESRS